MRKFVKRVSSKVSKLTSEQVQQLLDSLTEENEALDAVLESLGTGLLICNVDWHLKSENKAASRLIPITLHNGTVPVWELIKDIHIAEFLKSNSSTQKKNVSEKFSITTNRDSIDEDIDDSDEDNPEFTRFICISILPLVRTRKLSGYIIQIDDITEKHNQEALLRRMENLASLTNLAASVSHEIKNPLGAISIHIQLMQRALKKARDGDGKLPDKKFVENYLKIVNEEIERLNQIILDFLFAVRPISTNMELVDPTNLLTDFITFIHAELEEKHILFETELIKKPSRIMVDVKLFRQILINLAQNAIAAMPNGGFLWISTAIKNERFVLNIIDSGVGMDTQTQSRIFEPYFTTRAQGTGLGLTMVYKIVKEFSGEINVKSFPGEGTLFSINLPLPQNERPLLEYQKKGD